MMNKSFLWTESGARLQLIQACGGGDYNWFFLPGGPGLGSESLFPLFSILRLPGNLWRVDLPGDGSNIGNGRTIARWPQALLEVTNAFESVIFVGHSRGGMFLLALPELEMKIRGLVLMDSAPDRTWIETFALQIKDKPPTPEERNYEQSPNNETLKKFVLAGASLMFTKQHLEKGRKSLEELPYNHQAIQWTQQYFDPIYSAQWIPKNIPTLIFSGSRDLPTPLKLFSERDEFVRANILMREIKDAGHFPWIENPQEVVTAFEEYIKLLVK
jgi:pimeloyl-ACP methyl ester carboxylesterase